VWLVGLGTLGLAVLAMVLPTARADKAVAIGTLAALAALAVVALFFLRSGPVSRNPAVADASTTSRACRGHGGSTRSRPPNLRRPIHNDSRHELTPGLE
jgi:hypothetical protein